MKTLLAGAPGWLSVAGGFLLTLSPAADPALRGTPSQEGERARDLPTSEGPLDNDVFVPIDDGAVQALARGDQSLTRARAAGTPAEAARLLDVAFDAWREALAAGGPGACAWFDPSPTSERRLSEGVHAGCLRRLLALGKSESERWTARLESGAEGALAAVHGTQPDAHASSGRAARLGELVQLFPATPAAARAALELGDLALEAGRSALARGWYARADLEAELSGDGSVRAALPPRRTAAGAPRASEELDLWQRAAGCELVASFSWKEPGRRAAADRDGERGLDPGGAFVGADSFVLQTASELLLFSLAEGSGLEPSGRWRMSDLLREYTPELAVEAPRDPPGWPLLPHADEEGLALVVGRTRAGEPNALLALELEEPSPLLELGLQLGRPPSGARLSWAIVGVERVEPRGSEWVSEPVAGLEELGDYEFQPGPVASADRIVVQARQVDGQVRAWLLAFDRHDGRLAWKRLLASGADRIVTQRFAQTTKRVAGQPLLSLEIEGVPRVFAGTHLGLGVLVDSLLGEPLWGFKNRRRGEHDPGWSGDRPLLGRAAGGTPFVLWAPMDSDRLYTLAPHPLLPDPLLPDPLLPDPLLPDVQGSSAQGTGGVLLFPAAPLIDAHTLLGGEAEEHLVLGSTRSERTVSARRPGRDRVDALELGQDERFRGLGLVSPERVWASTNRSLYLFDRTRELYLLDHETLPPSGPDVPGGDLYARGASVLVVGSSALWSFRAR